LAENVLQEYAIQKNSLKNGPADRFESFLVMMSCRADVKVNLATCLFTSNLLLLMWVCFCSLKIPYGPLKLDPSFDHVVLETQLFLL